MSTKGLTVGSLAPPFALPDQAGATHRLADSRGQWVLLYFYPKDNTPGCTKQAYGVRDRLEEFRRHNVQVFGISVDSVDSHQRFAKKYRLSFPLLADDQKRVVKTYGVWRKKAFMGKAYFGTVRTSVLIDPDGRIAKRYEPVKPEQHAELVLGDVARLRQACCA